MIWLFLALLWIWAAAPTIHWLDTTELSLATASLGIGHPPGESPYLILGSCFQWFPLGDIAFRSTLFSLVTSLAAPFAVYLWMKRQNILTTTLEKRAVTILIVIFATSEMITLQAVRPEVYGLCAALTWGAVALSAYSSDARYNFLAWFCWGLALVTHPVIACFSLPFLFQKKISVGLLFALLAASSVLYLPLRAFSDPSWNFGDPATFDRLLWFLRGKLYKAYDTPNVTQTFANLWKIVQLLSDHLTPAALFLGSLGFIFILKKDIIRGGRIFVAVGIAMVPLAAMGNFWPDNPDALGYLTPVTWLCCFLSMVSLFEFQRFMKGGTRFLFMAFLIFWALVQGFFFFTGSGLARDWSARRHLLTLAGEPSPGARLETASFSTYSFLRYGQVMEGLRPDLNVRYRGLYNRREKEDLPLELEIRKEGSNVWWELAMDRTREGTYTLRKEELDLASKLHPQGWFCRIGERPTPPDWRKNLKHRTTMILSSAKQNRDSIEPLFLNYFLHRSLALKQNDIERADFLLKDSRELFPPFEGDASGVEVH